jgi:hypothetical protein
MYPFPSLEFSHFFMKAYIWDWLLSIPEEIKMCRQRKFSLPVAVYFFSR